MKKESLEQLSIDTVRVLAADAVQKANSGHPGTPMALAPVGSVLWGKIMHYNPQNPAWPNRDRFVLSAGHACLLQYCFLFLTGYDLTINDLKNFRQLHSKTAGHPERGLLDGIEVTTGPLGQGFANGVGMAIAQQWLAARYNKPEFELFDYKIYAVCSDGDLMEGICGEAASLAGHLQLGNMIYIYDDNHITIEGDTALAYNDNVDERFAGYGWHVQSVKDGNNTEEIQEAIEHARKETGRPSLIRIRTHIAFGSPNKVDTKEAHGAPLGEEEVKNVKRNLGFDPDQYFWVPDEVLNHYRSIGKEGKLKEKEWNQLFAKYRNAFPELAKEYEHSLLGKLPEGWQDKLPAFPGQDKIATRKASGKVINALAEVIPNLIGGAADLAPSTDTLMEKFPSFSATQRKGRNFHFGIREHAMGAILNGISVTGGFLPFGASFLIFSDYMRPPIRLAAIMKISPIFIYTHDSIALGEDGTTHQPVEQLISLRAIPGVTVIRPADANETAQAWRVAIEHKGGPVIIVLTRQGVPVIDQRKYPSAAGLEKGAYILSEPDERPELILIATGSEVQLVLQAGERLAAAGVPARVVSMPSWELFERQSRAYKEDIFPTDIRKRVAVEAGSTMGWEHYTTGEGYTIGIDKFGESAPGEQVMKEYGFTVENIVEKCKSLLSQKEKV